VLRTILISCSGPSLFFLSIEPYPGKLKMPKNHKVPTDRLLVAAKPFGAKQGGSKKRMRQNCPQKMSEESNQDSRFFRQFSV
jgi:hypothetical protein